MDRCYKLKLFLEQFSIPCCVLNSELPVQTRLHTVSQFNKGVYNVIVAADEKFLDEPENKKKKQKDGGGQEDKGKRVKDRESGVARGIDFQFVANVINFDFPEEPDSYIHRVGRTARGVQHGTALSLVHAGEADRLAAVEAHLEQVCGGSHHLRPYQVQQTLL